MLEEKPFYEEIRGAIDRLQRAWEGAAVGDEKARWQLLRDELRYFWWLWEQEGLHKGWLCLNPLGEQKGR